MPLNQTTENQSIVSTLICSIDLTLLQDCRFNPDLAIRDLASNLISQAFQVQAEAIALTEQLKRERIAELEAKWANALIEKERLENELATFKQQGYQLQTEISRNVGLIETCYNRLVEHRSVKQKWNFALVSPRKLEEWQSVEAKLDAALESARQQAITLNADSNLFNEETSVLANRIRVSVADAVYLYQRIQRLKGNKEPVYDAATGLSS
jgi:hypothetical protein